MSEQQPLLVTLKEAGRLLGGIGQTTVYGLLKKRELPCVKIGRSTRIELSGNPRVSTASALAANLA